MLSFLSKIYFGLGNMSRFLGITNENNDQIMGDVKDMPSISSERTTKVGRILDVIRKILNYSRSSGYYLWNLAWSAILKE